MTVGSLFILATSCCYCISLVLGAAHTASQHNLREYNRSQVAPEQKVKRYHLTSGRKGITEMQGYIVFPLPTGVP